VAKNISFELAIRSRDEFARYFAALLGELLNGVAESKRLGRLDQMAQPRLFFSNQHIPDAKQLETRLRHSHL
jgi:hypothetical protein